MLPKSLILSLVGVLLVTFSVFAGTSVLEGVVKDATGRPIKGADVRIEAKNFSKILKTDANGHYVTDGLAVGTYKVTLVINGQVKALILVANTGFNDIEKVRRPAVYGKDIMDVRVNTHP